MKKTILLSEQDLKSLINNIVALYREKKNIKNTELEIKNEIEDLEGKTVRFELEENGKNLGYQVYTIRNPKYEVTENDSFIRGDISFEVVIPSITSPLYIPERVYVDLQNGVLVMSSSNYQKGKKTIYKNEKLKKYFESILDKFPLFLKEKEAPETDF